ncbi:hypothetical protein CERSUDRAFT_39571, partial [Gelatoporia subvermispora B]
NRPIGRGGFGVVWKGRYRNRTVALKIFHDHLFLTSIAIFQLLFQEAVVWKYLRHPNITPFVGINTTYASLVLICDYMDGGNVVEYLKREPCSNRIQLTLDIAQALGYLHGMQIVHGDLKGLNILVNDEGRACLTNFGLTKLTYHDMLSTVSIQEVSLRWTTPELFEPERFGLLISVPTTASDIYSFALVMWEIFTGSYPFGDIANGLRVTFSIISGERPRRPRRAMPLGLDDGVWELMERCWQEDRLKRP